MKKVVVALLVLAAACTGGGFPDRPRDAEGDQIVATQEGVNFVFYEHEGEHCVEARAEGPPRTAVCTPRDPARAIDYATPEVAGRRTIMGLTDPEVDKVTVALDGDRRISFFTTRPDGWDEAVFGGLVDGPVTGVEPE